MVPDRYIRIAIRELGISLTTFANYPSEESIRHVCHTAHRAAAIIEARQGLEQAQWAIGIILYGNDVLKSFRRHQP